MALMDFKDNIEVLVQSLQILGSNHEFIRELLLLVGVGNCKETKALETAIKSKSLEF